MKLEMTSKQRAWFRAQAQTIDPVVMIGKEGITDGVVEALEKALYDHELVKVRFQDFKEETKSLSQELADKSDSTLIATTGFTAVFYKESEKKKK